MAENTNNLLEKNEKISLLKLVIITTLAFGAVRLLQVNRNLFFILLNLLIVFVFLTIAFIATKKKFKALFYAIGLFFFLHLLVFPLIYASLLKKDPYSLIINKEILSNEKSNAVSELWDEYSPDLKSKKITLLNQLLSSLPTSIDTSTDYLDNNFIVLDSFIISRRDTFILTGNEPGHGHAENLLQVHNRNGILISSLYEKSLHKKYYKKSKISEYLFSYKNYYNEEISSFSIQKEEALIKNRIWSYTRILPYSINIFTTDHFKPISRIANITYNIHYYLVWGLILTIIFSTIVELIINKLRN